MTRRIFRSIMAVSVSVLLIALIMTVGILYGYFSKIFINEQESRLELAVRGVENEGTEYLKGLSSSDYRLSLIAADGTVVYDTRADSAAMENHAERAEVKEALENGTGKSERFSQTLFEKTIYLTQRLSDGNVLRISATQRTATKLVIEFLWPLVGIFFLAVILSVLLAEKVSSKIVEPLNMIDMDNPLDGEVYDELAPLMLRIRRQNEKITDQVSELKQRQREFLAVTESMNEGLVMLSGNGEILSVNDAAANILGTDKDCVGKQFIEIERNPKLSEALNKAMRDGSGEMRFSQNGREYQINISRTGSRNGKYGAVMLIFDVTEKIFAERNRREFTANVSHELKTPLQSISGSAELIESGLVKQEDMPQFISNIRTESARLIALIDDIIRLSKLDEGADMPVEEADLYEIAKETIERIKPSADKRGIDISLKGESCVVKNAGRLVQEIVFNLCENAVKYNKDGGSVTVEAYNPDNPDNTDNPVLIVSDTGIGIPKEDIGRIFERFYRVDKSHSRQTGGTGLGLSIVKHAAEYLGAEIGVESEPDKGTTITVKFNK